MQIYLDTFCTRVHRFTQLCQPFLYVFYYSAMGHLYYIVGNYYISGNRIKFWFDAVYRAINLIENNS